MVQQIPFTIGRVGELGRALSARRRDADGSGRDDRAPHHLTASFRLRITSGGFQVARHARIKKTRRNRFGVQQLSQRVFQRLGHERRATRDQMIILALAMGRCKTAGRSGCRRANELLLLLLPSDLRFRDFTQRLVKMGLAQSMRYLRTCGPGPSQVSAANAAHRSDWLLHNVRTVTSLSALVQ